MPFNFFPPQGFLEVVSDDIMEVEMKLIKAAAISLLFLFLFHGCCLGCKDKSWKMYINNNSEKVARVVFYAHKNHVATDEVDKEIVIDPDEIAFIVYYGINEDEVFWQYVKVFLDNELAYECGSNIDGNSILTPMPYSSRHPKAKEAGGEVADLFRWCGDVLCENQCYINPPAVDPEPGEEGGACYGNGTCNEGLLCVDDICVKDPTDDDSNETGSTVKCYEDYDWDWDDM